MSLILIVFVVTNTIMCKSILLFQKINNATAKKEIKPFNTRNQSLKICTVTSLFFWNSDILPVCSELTHLTALF